MLRTTVLYFVFGMRKSVQFCLWVGLALLSWALLFDHNKDERSPCNRAVMSYVSRALFAFLIGALLWMVKTLLMEVLASSFHLKAYFDRIQESMFHQYVLETLSGLPVMDLQEKVGASESNAKLNVKAGQGKKGNDVGVIDVGKLQRMNQDKVSVWRMKSLANMISSSGLSTISNAIDESVSGGDGGSDGQINSEAEARAAACRIFWNVAKPDSKFIDEEDLMRFSSTDEMQKIFPQFEGVA